MESSILLPVNYDVFTLTNISLYMTPIECKATWVSHYAHLMWNVSHVRKKYMMFIRIFSFHYVSCIETKYV